MSMAMNGETLDFKHIYQENRGAMHEGRLQLLNEKVVFKHSKTGKVDTMTPDDITRAYWRRVAKNFELKFTSKSGVVLRFDGFHDSDFGKLKEFLQDRYDIELEEKELSAKGWNWGKADFQGDEMVFDVSQKTSFEIPLMNVSQCTQSKDEVTLEFHQNEDTDLISLMEMRFYIPPSQDDDVDRVQAFHESVMAKADVLQVKGNAVCTFHDMKFLTPRGHYDVRMYPKFIQLHGKTYDYKITYTSILRLFLLPNKDQRQIFFVISMDPPLKQGQTRYHFLIMLFQKEVDLSVELVLDDELKDRLHGKLDLEHSGPAYEVVSKIIRHMASRKITVPGNFSGANGSQSITCSYKASSGILFPLPRGFMYVIKPPIHIRFDEISFVNFARGASSMNKSFDFEIETKNKVMHIFSNIEKGQYTALYDFVSQKQLRIKNIGKDGGYNDNMKGSDDSDDDAQMHDPYMYRMKQEAADRDEDFVGQLDADESEDEDFAPEENDEDVKEEFDSNASSSSDEDEDGAQKKPKKPRREESSDDEPEEEEEEEEDPEERRRKERKLRAAQKEKERKKKKAAEPTQSKQRRKKAKKDPNAPKRPSSAYMLWLNESREQLKEKNPSLSLQELMKVAGMEWKALTSDAKSKYEKQYLRDKEVYQVKMAEYKKSGGGAAMPGPSSSKSSAPRKPPSKAASKPKSSATSQNSSYKSKEYIQSSDDSSSDSDVPAPKLVPQPPPPKKKKEQVEVPADEDMPTESEAEDTPASSSDESD